MRSVPVLIFALVAVLALPARGAELNAKLDGLSAPAWGRISAATNGTGRVSLEVATWPADGKLVLPTPFPHITSARQRMAGSSESQALSWVFNADATALHLELATTAPAVLPAIIDLDTAETSTQFTDGRITFSALDAAVAGTKAKLESHPGNHRIGFWTDASDSVSWNYKPTRWGMYDVELTYSADGGEGTQAQVEVAGQSLTVSRPTTGSWYRYTTLKIGRYYLEKSDPFAVKVAGSKLTGAAVMNLKAVTLRPAPEGDRVAQGIDGSVVLEARQARTHSVLMRYEPASIKNCLGYWANAQDWADWEFTTARPGVFEVEVWQGCGKGQGGSDVRVEVDGQPIDFVVEETGHFQIFLPRRLGRVVLSKTGVHSLSIKPQRKQAGAVMDIRQVKLLPVASSESPSKGWSATPLGNTLLGARRVVFLGDSITYAGEWIEFLETALRLGHPRAAFDFINIGLPSETVSGLSEPGHAGGSFPRPGLHERLERVLARARPDVVVACYGMNDGIYHPLSEERFEAYRAGMRLLRERAAAAGAKVIHVTPPTFDAVPLKGHTLPAGLKEYRSPYEGYNQVLDRYSEWLLAQRSEGWEVVDIHAPMNRFLEERRKTDPKFQLAGDGVHANSQGHWLIAREVLKAAGAPDAWTSLENPGGITQWDPRAAEVLKWVQQSHRSRKDAWLTYTGHVRPGMGKGKPLATAEAEAQVLAIQSHQLLDVQFPGKRSRWNGFERFDFEVGGRNATVIAPKNPAPGRPWAWHGEFFGHKPNPDIALLGRGFHIVYLSVPNMLGSPGAVAHWNTLYEQLTGRFGFGPKPALVGLSRGGLYVYNWAIANPGKVSCIYGDAPVCDFRSWPGAFGKGKRSDSDWALVLKEYGFKNDDEARAYRGNPVDRLDVLAAAKVPLLHVYGDADEVVPWDENTGVVADRYRKLGGSITLIAKPGVKHHPHGLDDSTPIVEFLWKHGASEEAQKQAAASGGGPLDAWNRPLIRKLGTVDADLVEATPVVFNGQLLRFEWVRQGEGQQYWDNKRRTNYFRFRNPESGGVSAPFADGYEFGSAFVSDGVMYVTGTLGRSQVDVFASKDLKQWERWTAIPAGRYGVFNTSVCRAEKDFVLMFEINSPAEEAGHPFTARFARSPDFRNWTVTPPECNYAKDRYTAPHCLRWSDGWFYNFYLEAYHGYEMRVVRSRDLVHWDSSPKNPVLVASQEDKLTTTSRIPDSLRGRIANAVNSNNSDLDFCEWNGRLFISYSWGNQHGVEHLAEAMYDGSESQFLRGWF